MMGDMNFYAAKWMLYFGSIVQVIDEGPVDDDGYLMLTVRPLMGTDVRVKMHESGYRGSYLRPDQAERFMQLHDEAKEKASHMSVRELQRAAKHRGDSLDAVAVRQAYRAVLLARVLDGEKS